MSLNHYRFWSVFKIIFGVDPENPEKFKKDQKNS